jgi:hypothetical protein
MRSPLLIVSFCLGFGFANAQTVPINDLNIPTSPAFVMLGQSPASIEKPSNPKALGLSLINLWQGNGAVEFTPYWLTNKPSYTFSDDVKNKNPIFQTFAFSVATVKEDSATTIAAGFRTQLARSYSKSTIALINTKMGEIVDELSNGDNINETKIKELYNEINNLKSKTNWIVEVAGAYAGRSSSTQSISAYKSGIWAHLKWTPDASLLDFVGLVRYTSCIGNVPKGTSDSTFLDYGINISHQGNDFDMQLEYVNRRDFSIKETYDRLVFVANYQIMPGVVAVASFGKDFTKVNNIFSAIGIKFGLSKEKMKISQPQ